MRQLGIGTPCALQGILQRLASTCIRFTTAIVPEGKLSSHRGALVEVYASFACGSVRTWQERSSQFLTF